MTTTPKKKLIETSLPLEAINAASAREKSIRHGHPSTLHLYWARRPLAAARAVLFAQLVDDPSARPEEFPTQEAQDIERKRLHQLMERLVLWKNSNDEELFRQANEEIRKSNNGELPVVLDPFAGGGSIPLEAQRLGLEAHASDLNPLAVLINKALIEIPPKFADQPPVFPGAAEEQLVWERAEGLAADVRHYGKWMRDEAEKRIGHLYPKVKGSDGKEHTVIAWIWARTVKNPNPANPIMVPLVKSWWLSRKVGREAWIKPSVSEDKISYLVVENSDGPEQSRDGTRVGRGGISLVDHTPITSDYIKEEGRAGRIGEELIAVIAEDSKRRLYLSPTEEQSLAASVEPPKELPDIELPYDPRNIWAPSYGLEHFTDLFTNRQLRTLATLSSLLEEVKTKLVTDYLKGKTSTAKEDEATTYANSVTVYLSLAISKLADYNSSLCSWHNGRETISHVFTRQAIPMVWDFAEANPFSSSSGNFSGQLNWISKVIENLPASNRGVVAQVNALQQSYSGVAVSTDPPYYDMVSYADLSDFFYIWLRPALREVYPDLMETMVTPKSDELIANAHRHNGKIGAEKFFIEGFNAVFSKMRKETIGNLPMTVYYAYKQQDAKSLSGWHTLLDGLIHGGWTITATWPVSTELKNRTRAQETNSLASSIVLACRPRPEDAPVTTRREFISALKRELPVALRTMMQGTIAPVDLAQAAIGPGISIFSRYSRVREANGSDMTVKEALELINATLDSVLDEQESDYDGATRFAIKWYRSYGWNAENSGIADQLARSTDTSIGALERGGIFSAKGGKARLLAPSELEDEWDPTTDDSVSVWEATVRLAATMNKDGADKVAQLLPDVQERVNIDAVKELGFLLFHEAEKNNDAKDALLFNSLVSAWGDVTTAARQYAARPRAAQAAFDFEGNEE